MVEFVPAAAMSALVVTIINFLRYARAADVNGALTIIMSWAAGIGSVMLAAQTQFAGQIGIGASSLAGMSGWSQVFIGVTVASAGGVLVEFKQALDRGDSAAKPKLVPTQSTAGLPDGPDGRVHR